MAFLVPLIPLLGCLLIVMLRRRPARTHWAVGVAVGVGYLLLLAAAARALPLENELTSWAPASLFHGRILLRLNASAWLLSAATGSLLLADLLIAVQREAALTWRQLAVGYLYLGLATLAYLAGNLLTVVLAWAMLDVLAYGYLLSGSEQLAEVRAHSTHFILRGASTVVVFAAAIPEAAGGGGPVTEALEVTLLSAAVWLRCRLWPLPLAAGSASGRPLLGELDRLVPSAMALALLAHGLGGSASGDLALVLILIGISNVVLGAAAWLHSAVFGSSPTGTPGWTLAVGGVALLLVTQPRVPGGLEFAWWGAALLVLGGVHLWRRVRLRRQRVLLLAGTGMLVLGPAVLSAPASGALSGAQAVTIGPAQLATALAAVALGLGLAAGSGKEPDSRTSSEPFGETALAVGAVLPLLALAAGLVLFGGLPGATAGAMSLAQLLLVGLAWFLLRRSEREAVRGFLADLSEPFAAVASRAEVGARRVAIVGLDAVHLVGEVIEGRAALLWVLVVVVALAVSTGGA